MICRFLISHIYQMFHASHGIKNYSEGVFKMGLDFSKAKPKAEETQTDTVVIPEQEIEAVTSYDIVADRQQMNTELVNSPEVDAIVSTIEIDNLESIVSFGSEAADEISKASDVVLNSMNMSQLDESSQMLVTLSKIMEKFDIDEIKEDPSLFGRIFGNMKTSQQISYNG